MNTITTQKLDRYFEITGKAIEKAKISGMRVGLSEDSKERIDFLDMIERYYSDAKHFASKNDFVNAFACLNYAHGWLDAGARIGLFDVRDNKLFSVDE